MADIFRCPRPLGGHVILDSGHRTCEARVVPVWREARRRSRPGVRQIVSQDLRRECQQGSQGSEERSNNKPESGDAQLGSPFGRRARWVQCPLGVSVGLSGEGINY